MFNTSFDFSAKQKLFFNNPTSEADSLTNYLELTEPIIQIEPQQTQTKHFAIRKQIQQLKSKRRRALSLKKDINHSQLMMTSTIGTQKITVQNQSEDDKFGAVFSPFKQKSKMSKVKIDSSIDWQRRADKCDRDQEENAIIKNTLEIRRNFVADGLKRALGKTLTVKSVRNSSRSLSKNNIKALHSSRLSLPQNVFLLRLQRLKQLYSVLAQILMSISKDKQSTIQASQKFINTVSSLNLQFIDDFIEQSEQRLQKAIRYSRFTQSTSIVYLMLQLLKVDEQFQIQRVNLSNLIGHSASNIILLTRMFVLQFKQQSFHQSEFEACIDRYEVLQFKQKIDTIEQALTRVCHNNDIIRMLLLKLGRSNNKFSKVLRQFLKKINRKKEITASEHNHYLFEFFAFYLHENQLNNIIPLIDIAPNPYLIKTEKPYTIIIEPYGTLVLMKNGKIKVRPYVFEILCFLCQRFSVILWSWMMPSQIQPMLAQLPAVPVDKILYRYHCKEQGDIYIKNLNRLGRDLSRVLLIDYSKQVFQMTPDNGIECGWSGSNTDKKLLDLRQLIDNITQNFMNIEQGVKVFNQQISLLKMVKFRSRRKSRV